MFGCDGVEWVTGRQVWHACPDSAALAFFAGAMRGSRACAGWPAARRRCCCSMPAAARCCLLAVPPAAAARRRRKATVRCYSGKYYVDIRWAGVEKKTGTASRWSDV